MKKLANAEVIEPSHLYVDLSDSLLEKIDVFLCNTDLTKRQQQELIKIFEEIYGESFTNAIVD